MTNMELLGGVSAVAVIVGLVEAAKMLGLKDKYAPLLSLILGQAASFAYYFYRGNPLYQVIVTGLVLGLCAMGLYDCARDTIKGLRKI